MSSSLIPILVVIAGTLLTGTMAKTVARNKTTEERNNAELNAKIYANYLASDIEKGIAVTETIEQTIIASNGDTSTFSKVAENLIDDTIQSIQICPNGIVTEIYPAEGNEAGLIDMIHRDDERGVSCRYARDNDVIIMQGPFDLLQGGQGLAIRNPIYLENEGQKEFWGFSIVIIKVPDVFDSTLNDLASLGYSYRLSKTNTPISDDYVEVYSSSTSLLDNPVIYEFETDETKWKLEITPIDSWFDPTISTMTIAPSVLVYIAIAIAIFLFSERKDKQQAKQNQLLEENLEMMHKEQELRKQVQLYAVAMGVAYPLAIDMDYYHNQYQMIEYDGFLNKSADYNGSIDDLIRIGASTIPDEKQAKEFSDLFNISNVTEAFRKGQKELSLRHKQIGDDQKIHWMETKAICIECTEDSIRGISMSKCIDEEVNNEELRIEAEKANNAKSNFLLRMSHDIRTPLNGIMGMLDIADEYPNDFSKQEDCRKKARKSAEVLLELISEVLDMSKLESGEITLEHVSFDLMDISKTNYLLVNDMAKARNIEIIQKEYKIPKHRLIGSPVHFKRIIMNIITNAIKYNKDNGKIYISCKEETIDESHVNLIFSCADTGIGMSKTFLEHVYEPFSQENQSARSSYEGTGLGMAIAKSLTEKMGGTINVSSEENVGTTVIISIPFEVDDEEYNPKVIEDESPSIKGYKVILAEDNELNKEIAKFMLEEQGVEVIEASDGKEALDAFIKSQPYEIDAILMDIMMPNMDGYEATKCIRALNREDSKLVPIIALTASAFAEDRVAAKEAGMNEHLAKPLDAKLAIKTIAHAVENYRLNR